MVNSIFADYAFPVNQVDLGSIVHGSGAGDHPCSKDPVSIGEEPFKGS